MRRALFIVMLAMAPSTRAQDGLDVGSLITTGTEWARDNLPAAILDQIQMPSRSQWQEFLQGIQKQLSQGSVEDLAEWLPYVELGYQLLAQIDDGTDTAAWLRQRLDYFEMAGTAVNFSPVAGTPRIKPIPLLGGQPVHLVPPTSPGRRPVPPAIIRKREMFSRNTMAWQRKLKNRPVPDQATILVPRLKRIFKSEGLPPELVWIAEVESSMNPRARNPSGSAGLFQFMPETAKRFDLALFPVDERKDPDKSARAAARYLRFLYREFNSWPLAIAAYNAGEGRLQSTLEGQKNKTFDAIADNLPLETRMYVPKVTAVINLREGVINLNLPAPKRDIALNPFMSEGVCCEI